MASICFYAEKRRDKKTGLLRTENVPVRMLFSFEGNRLTLTTGEKLDLKHWDQKKQRVLKTARGSVEINNLLTKLAEDVQRAYRELRILGEAITPQILLARVRNSPDNHPISNKSSFFDALNKYEEIKQSSFSNGFARHVKSTKKYLKEYAPKNLTFQDIDMNFMEGFASFLTYRGLSLNSVAGQIKRLKIFLNYATKNGDNTNMKYKGYTAKTHEPEIFFLTLEELKVLREMKFEDSRLEKIRDVFMFGCYTAMRFSDISRLRKIEIKDGFIRFRQVKTKEENTVPLVSVTKEILEKYKSIPGPLALPVVSKQKMNDYLKELGRLAGFNDPVTVVKFIGSRRIETVLKKYEVMTSHMMRRTFISNSLIMQIPESEVMALSGHKSYSAFKRYFKVRDEQKLKAMQKWENIPV